MNKIFWASDSTVQYNSIETYPQTGMGQVIHLYLKPEVEVVNHAKNGRSTKSFLDQGRFEPIQAAMGEGDFLFVQFGHNDEKITDPERYTEPQGAYKDNLRFFISEAKKRGAKPVLISPLTRRTFEDGQLAMGDHWPYCEAMEQVAKEENVPFIDLHVMSRELVSAAGDEKTREWFMHVPANTYPHFPDGLGDNTHLKYEGAVKFAGCICRGLKELGGEYAALLREF